MAKAADPFPPMKVLEARTAGPGKNGVGRWDFTQKVCQSLNSVRNFTTFYTLPLDKMNYTYYNICATKCCYEKVVEEEFEPISAQIGRDRTRIRASRFNWADQADRSRTGGEKWRPRERFRGGIGPFVCGRFPFLPRPGKKGTRKQSWTRINK